MALIPLAPETRNLIDGTLAGASNGNTFENVSPSTEEVLGTLLRLREDRVTESDARERFQAIAPLTDAGLYLVPKVIE